MFDLATTRIGVIGLGYVGLPLAVEFGKHFPTVGLDINAARINELQAGTDSTLEVAPDELCQAGQLRYASHAEELAGCTVYVVTVPTPVDAYKRPDFGPLIGASVTAGRLLKPGDVAIYESTVYPGATEEVCVPILERDSGLRFNVDFFAGYSPERINPGSGGVRRCAVPADHQRRHSSSLQHPGGGSGQGHRKHSARCQYRLD